MNTTYLSSLFRDLNLVLKNVMKTDENDSDLRMLLV